MSEIQKLEDDSSALMVRASDASFIAAQASNIDPSMVDRVHLQILTPSGSASFLATAEEAAAIAEMINRQAAVVRGQLKR